MSRANPRAKRSVSLNNRVSLRLKLTVWTMAIAASIQLGGAAILVLKQRQTVDTFFTSRMAARTTRVIERVALLPTPIMDSRLIDVIAGLSYIEPVEHLWVGIYTLDGRLEVSTVRPAPDARSLNPADPSMRGPGQSRRVRLPGFTIAGDIDGVCRVMVTRVMLDGVGERDLVIAGSDVHAESMLNQALGLALASIPIGIFATGVGAWLISGLVLRPLRDLAVLSQSLNPDQLDQPVVETVGVAEVDAIRSHLEQARNRLRAAFAAQDQFISNVSHEIKTPISVILTEAEVVSMRPLPPESKDFVKSTIEELRWLGAMINSFLMLATVRNAKKPDALEPCSMHDVVLDAIGRCHGAAVDAKVMIEPVISGQDVAPIVIGDPELLCVMVENLIRNAVRFTKTPPQVLVRVETAETLVQVCIRDFGPGIAPELIDHVFEQFVRAKEQPCEHRGHGLGLSIARGIAELHGGRIGVRNMDDGAGCEFFVTLPLALPDAEMEGNHVVTPRAI